MATSDHLNCYTGRIASFQEPKQLTKRRASSTRKKTATSVSWPHTAPSIEDLAQSGFYYSPTANHPDNVTCFMCKHKLDNWEPHDDPAIEHLALAPDCAWAISTSVYRRRLDENEDPMSEKMADARKATFVEWPHEGKRGWKCNIKSMVEAGWCFDPSPEFDDGVSCFYCQLSLDGWESTDDPTEEHQRRSPRCPFFKLLKVYGGARKAVKGKKGRPSTASRASRHSVQSSKDFDTFSEAPSLMSLGDDAVHNEDSILTATQAGTMAKGKKGTGKGKAAAKGGKKNARSKKATEEPSAVAEMDTALEGTEEPLDLGDIEAKDEDSVMTAATNTSTASRTTRGRKASAKAKRPAKTTRKTSRTTKKPAEPEPLVLEEPVQDSLPADDYMSPASPSARTTRNNSRLETSYLSPAMPSARTTRNTSKLEASYLEQIATEVEELELKLPKQRATRGRKKMIVDDSTLMSNDATQLPSEMQDDANKAAELAADQAEQELVKPKRGRKRTSDGVPKDDSVSVVIPAPKETKKRGKKAKQPEESSELPQDVQEPEPEPEPVAKPASKPKRGRKKQAIEESVVDAAEEEPQVAHSPQTRASTPAQDENEAPAEAEPSAVAAEPTPLKEPTPAPRSPTPLPKEQTPSPSPQSSDAENKPPSTRPSATRPPLSTRTPFSARTVRIPLAETTPRTSPSKRTNNIGPSGLRTALPWEPVDLENIFLQSPSTKRLMRGLGDTDTDDKENDEQEAAGLDAAVQRVRRQLTSPEKRMTVEQWVQFQAEAGESRLRGECERMVGLFETASTRALRTLEGVESS
ncbi:hypothetical protein IWX90DRAFT_441328 [Phyllosticta citrichinensis]|uniref:Protein bir1 n=1 Tax=Phyllosticta citrichinensis TaxID=1130410 RepID=A0ABR1XMA3_9PEZI